MRPILVKRKQWKTTLLARVKSSFVQCPERSCQQQSCRSILSSAVQLRLETMVKRHAEIMEEMHGSGHTSAGLSKELSSLSTVVSFFQTRQSLEEEKLSLQDLLSEASDAGDKDIEKECRHELEQIETEKEKLDRKIVNAVLPQDEDDYESDAIIEVRAGTGGDEASLFAGELLESYSKTAKSLKWNVEILQQNQTDIGGIRGFSMSVSGGASFRIPAEDADDDAPLVGPYGAFKFESGVHRVQRVPINDSKIHTSACSVAVLPSISEHSNSKELLPVSELKIETMRASGAGGQHVNTTDSAVRITHVPTGITASIQDERSQHKNKEKALKLIAARVRGRQRAEEERARGDTKSSLMGGGDRSERIRTYNFPQDRVTDHRCKISKNGIDQLLNGGETGIVVSFLPLLKSLHREELLKRIEEEEESIPRS